MKKVLALACLLVLTACSTVSTYTDPKADLSTYKTYRWVGESEAKLLNLGSPPTVDYVMGYSDVTRRNDLEPELKSVVDQTLHAKGFSLAADNPDFFVTVYGRAKDSDWVSTYQGSVPSVNNVPVIMYPAYDLANARTYRDGMLVLVFYDAKTKKPAWTGVMADVLHKKDVDLASISSDLRELTQQFPG
jgi:hypothetical protein